MYKELGYYTCDNKVFETKLLAMLYANPLNKDIVWNFNNTVFDTYRWDIPPEKSLDYYYDLRAKEIREEYDYVVLSYSGGSDSHNMLQSFIRQGLHIDEIVTNWALDASSKFIVTDPKVTETWNNNAEFHLNTRYRLEEIRNKLPRTKITVLDTSDSIIKALLNDSSSDWILGKNDVFNVTGAFQYNPLFFAEVRKRFDGLGRVAYVLGIDKPKLVAKHGKLYLYFIDKASSIAPVKESLTEYSNVTPVLFYWSPRSVDMLCKQAHTVLNLLNKDTEMVKVWESESIFHRRRVQEEVLKTTIYTTWNTNWFQVKKTVNDWDSELDYWFTRGMKDSQEYHIWRAGLSTLLKLVPNFIMRDSRGFVTGTRPYYSKPYFIGNIINHDNR